MDRTDFRRRRTATGVVLLSFAAGLVCACGSSDPAGGRTHMVTEASRTLSLPVPGPKSPVTVYDPAQRLRSVVRHLTPGQLRLLRQRTRLIERTIRECRRAGAGAGSALQRCVQHHALASPP